MNLKVSLLKRLLVTTLLLFAVEVHAVEPGVLLAAQNMLAKGQSLDALDLLSPHEEEYAGDKEYDYLYGLALLDTGDAPNSIFAFQRVLAVDPNFAGARLELARAYYQMGQLERSEREFLILKSQQPPKSVQTVIDKYLASIENQSIKNKQGWAGYLQLGFGNDTNVNNATSDQQFLGFDLTSDSRATDSTLVSTLAAVGYDLPLTKTSKFFALAAVNQRNNNDAAYTNTLNFDVSGGYSTSLSRFVDLSLGAQYYTARVDGEFNNKGAHLVAKLGYEINASYKTDLFLRHGVIDYTTTFDVKDVDQTLLGASLTTAFDIPKSDYRVSLALTGLSGSDSPHESDSLYGRDYLGARISASLPISHRINVFSSLGTTRSHYDSMFFDSTGNRKDKVDDFSIGTSWRVNKQWLLKAVLGRTNSISNVAIFDYDKTLFLITARSEFRP